MEGKKMKSITLVYEDEVFEALKRAKDKGGVSWEKYIARRILGK
jgi:hypothetical protein